MSRERIVDAAIMVTALCAVAVVGLLIRREFFPAPAHPAIELPRVVHDWRSYASQGQRFGPANARVTITDFSDYQCPYCKRLQASLDTLRLRFPDDVAIVYRHFPIEVTHPHARTAALATECAAAQGRFEPFHRALFDAQDLIGSRTMEQFADTAGVPDISAFRACVRERRFDKRITEDVEAATRLGITGTPTLLVNEKLTVGAPSLESLQAMVREAL